MHHQEIDRALSRPGVFEPGPFFLERVMAAVRSVQTGPPPLAFPWRSIAASLAALLLSVAGGAVLLVRIVSSTTAAATWLEVARRGDVVTARAAMWTLFALALCGLVAHASARALDA